MRVRSDRTQTRWAAIGLVIVGLAGAACKTTRPTADAGAVDAAASGQPPTDAAIAVDGGEASADGGTSSAVPRYPDNAVWLTHDYTAYASFVAMVPDLATRMSRSYGVTTLLPSVGTIGAQGTLSSGPSLSSSFLDAVGSWEQANGAHLRVLPWFSGPTDSVDLTNVAVQTAIRGECKKLLLPAASGSYVATATRPFDGVVLDFEPSGLDATRFAALIAIIDGIHSDVPQAKVGVAAHALGTGDRYHWAPDFYAQMARHADLVFAMTYDSGSANAAAYQTWMQSQVPSILDAIATGNGQPRAGFRLFIGFPAYPGSTYHLVAAETVAAAAAGTRAALTQLAAAHDPAAGWFAGASVYLHTDGSGSDGYAGWTTDWASFAATWLQ